jgi:hypothetical protein
MDGTKTLSHLWRDAHLPEVGDGSAISKQL